MTPKPKLKEGSVYNYRCQWYSGNGVIKEIYWRKNGWWIIIHDAKNNRSAQCRPKQVW